LIYFIGKTGFIDSSIYSSSSVEECLRYFSNHDEIAVDTETQGKDCHSKKIICLQIGDNKNQFVIDVRSIDILNFKNLLETKKCILHNSKFDYKFLKKAGIVLENIYDTMLAECVLYCGYEKYGYGLKDLAQRYLQVDLDKTTRGDFHKVGDIPYTDKQIEYAALDVTYLHKIKEIQETKAKELDLTYCVNLENEVVKAIADIEYNGMYLNKDKWIHNTTHFRAELDTITNQLDKIVESESKLSKWHSKGQQGNLFGYTERDIKINYASPSQIYEVLKALGFEIDSTNDRELSKIAKRHPFCALLQEYREKAKIISTYGIGFLRSINTTTNRVHTSFWQVLNTGRVSSGSKEDNAPNLQNIPASNTFRNCFEAREGYAWVSIDYSGQELRLMADASNEEGFIDVLNRGEDLHCYAGSMMFKRTITKADKELRNKAKTINFGKPYGMGPPKLADTLGISLEEANELFEIYAHSFPKLNEWLKYQGVFAKKNKYSVTFFPCKRRRWYPDMDIAINLRKTVKYGEKETWKRILTIEGQTERNGGNSPIQGSGADICKEALIEVRNLIKRYNKKWNEDVAYLICTVHDAIDVEVREDLAQEFSKEMASLMIEVGNKYVSKVKMEVDTTITKCWQK